MVEVSAGGTTVAVCNVDGEYHAVDGSCPHRGGPLAHGALHGNVVVCPWHAWEFDCVTGCYDYDPGIKLPKYSISVEGRDVYVEVT